MGNRERFLTEALDKISQYIGIILRASAIYETDSWGFESDEKFLNQVIAVKTNLSPYNLLDQLKNIEKQLGRIRTNQPQYSDRPIDLDILLYNDLIIREPDLMIPHPRMHLRKFTLLPLTEIAAKKLHPRLKLSIEKLLDRCSDKMKVRLYKPANSLRPVNHEV